VSRRLISIPAGPANSRFFAVFFNIDTLFSFKFLTGQINVNKVIRDPLTRAEIMPSSSFLQLKKGSKCPVTVQLSALNLGFYVSKTNSCS